MQPDDLLTCVASLDYGAILVAQAEGSAAFEPLRPWLAHVDPEVRELAEVCLAATGEPRAFEDLVELWADPVESVAMAAITSAAPLASPVHVPVLFDSWSRLAFPAV